MSLRLYHDLEYTIEYREAGWEQEQVVLLWYDAGGLYRLGAWPLRRWFRRTYTMTDAAIRAAARMKKHREARNRLANEAARTEAFINSNLAFIPPEIP